uniref:Uncharacterized protein n=1 Tax=Arundo donax TaxID=35708 RepID=A0A0A8YVP3_ARUDO
MVYRIYLRYVRLPSMVATPSYIVYITFSRRTHLGAAFATPSGRKASPVRTIHNLQVRIRMYAC